MPEKPSHWRRAARSVVRIEHGDSFGTAFLLDPAGLFLTAYHVVASAWRSGDKVRIVRGPTVDTIGTVAAVDASRDLAVVKVELPTDHRLRLAALALRSAAPAAGHLIAFHLKDPNMGIVGPIETASDHIGETAVAYLIDGAPNLIDRVWSRQDLIIVGGTSGAPAVHRETAAIVAVACAGADDLHQAFFVPLGTALPGSSSRAETDISKLLLVAQDRVPRLGTRPNGRGLQILGWLATRAAAQSLVETAVYDPRRSLTRQTLLSTIEEFLHSGSRFGIVAGVSGVGKSTSIAELARHRRLSRPVIFLRAAQLDVGTGGLHAAVAKALSVETLDHLPREIGSSPLLIIDGFNELQPFGRGRELVVGGELTRLVLAPALKNWKILVTTRAEALHDFGELPLSIAPFNPQKEIGESDDKNQGGPDRLFDEIPHIRLDGYTRVEFEEIRRIYGLPPTLPYDVFRHPFVCQLAVRALGGAETSHARVRDLLRQYYATIIDRIHARLGPGKNRELVAARMEELTANSNRETFGVIPTRLLDSNDDLLIAESAVAEGFLEHVPGGYRYVYDEVFEYVRARTLAIELIPLFDAHRENVIGFLEKLRQGRLSPSLIARALELAGDRDAGSMQALACGLQQALLQEDCDPFAAHLLTRVLARIERGGPLEVAKEALPIVTGNNVDGSAFFALSESHLSYSFSVKQLCQIVRTSAAVDRDRDSHPFRSKDLLSEDGSWSAQSELMKDEVFAPLRHLIDIAPAAACDFFCAGLSETKIIGREHSFGNFCAHVLAVFHARFNRDKLIQAAGIEGRSFDLFERIARHEHAYLIDHFLDPVIGFVAVPDVAARCLHILARGGDPSSCRLSEIAVSLVLEYNHPVGYFGGLFSARLDCATRSKILELVSADWSSCKMTVFRLADFVPGLVSVEQALMMCRQRLSTHRPNHDDRPDFMLSALLQVLLDIPSRDVRSQLIDIAVEMTLEQPRSRGYELASGSEILLRLCESVATIPPRLDAFLARLSRDDPVELCGCAKYYLFSSFGKESGLGVRQRAANVIVQNVKEIEAIFIIVKHGAERTPNSPLLPMFIQWFFDIGQGDWLYQELTASTNRIVCAIVPICTILGHPEFETIIGERNKAKLLDDDSDEEAYPRDDKE